ncbi:hypothetical protein AMQ83_16600 [Paenibacillus riograndensis]|nr:hypothetical protein AMQ83_16600 [Paenibacillus riograndensis]
MGREEISHEYQDIRAAAACGEQLPSIEVTGQVMARVKGLERVPNRSTVRVANKTAATLSMLILLLLIAVTAYAASEYIQIRNKAGVVKVQHFAPDLKPKGVAAYYKYEWKLMDFAKPGEQIAYYFRGEPIPEGGSLLQFAYKEQRITDYSAFLEQMKRKNSPVVLPGTAGEYAFKYGTMYPGYPTKAEQESSPFYRQTLNELVDEAKQDKARNLFMKVVPWTETESVKAVYTKQGAFIDLSASLLHGGEVQVYQEPENKPEKLRVEGRDIVYNHVDRPDIKPGFSYHYLNWYNEAHDAYYTLTTYGDWILTKAQLLKLAGEVIKGGL